VESRQHGAAEHRDGRHSKGTHMARRAHDVYTEWRGGTCRVKWWTGEYHANGRKRFESLGGFTDEDTAYEHGQAQMHDIRQGTQVSNRDAAMPLGEWAEQWMGSLDLAHLTMRNYRWVIRQHIKPYFAGRTVGEIDVLDFRAFKKCVGEKLSDNSTRNIIMVFGQIMDDAVKVGLRKTSPVERQARRGRYKRRPKERKKDMTVEAVQALAGNAQLRWGDAGYVFFWTMAMTGMRPSELYGLTRDYCYPNWPASDPRPDPSLREQYDDDLRRYGKGPDRMPAIRVERQVQYDGAGKIGFFPPKYESTRTLVIPDFLAEALELLLNSHDSEWVFPAIAGGCLARTKFDVDYWRLIADGAPESNHVYSKKPRPEIPPVPDFAGRRMYLIRHGHKAWLDEDGHSRYAVENRMGHEVQGVEGVYSSLTVPMEQAIRKTLQARWAGLGAPAWRPGAASEYARRGTLADLVRAAIQEQGVDLDRVLSAVEKDRAGVRRETVMRYLARERAKTA
jgi:integrase